MGADHDHHGEDCSSSFVVKFSFKGKSANALDVTRSTTGSELLSLARSSLAVEDDVVLRLIFKGKTIARDAVDDGDDANNGGNDGPAFPEGTKVPKGGAKVIVMGSAATGIAHLNSLKSDPLMRGFDDEKKLAEKKANAPLSTHWGPRHQNQHGQYKFCKFRECTDASFGSRPGSSTPHAFRARELLERLATDPGMVSVLTSRELVVGTLGEMDPIDDRLMQKKASEGACLLGYNTNRGLRIDIKLRTDDLSGFRPYRELASTLIHELSHNWVGEHDVVFWTNYGQMRVEYLWRHARSMRGGGGFAGGGKRSTAELAGVVDMISPDDGGQSGFSGQSGTRTMDFICHSVMKELAREMAQHRLPAQLVMPAVLSFSRELMDETKDDDDVDVGGHRLGTASTGGTDDGVGGARNEGGPPSSARERALAAAEKRARESREARRGNGSSSAN